MISMLLFLALLCPMVLGGQMDVRHSWTFVDFTFPSEYVRNQYISTGQFIPKNNIIIDVDVWNHKVFVTLPKLYTGSPVTLATVTDITRNGVTLLKPYPDWSWHQGDCGGIISVFRTQVDECGRLWVLDSGIIEAFSASIRKCPPKLLVFDLHTNKLLRRHIIPESMLDRNSKLITVVVDTRKGHCGGSFAYMADVEGFNIFVYDFGHDKSWKVSNNLFYPDPLSGDFNINGVNFQLMDGVFGLALGPVINGDRLLYFHSLASVRESFVPTSVLRNGGQFLANSGAASREFRNLAGTRQSQSSAQAMTNLGVLLYALVEENAVGCWNTKIPFNKENQDIVAKDDKRLQFQSGLKVYNDEIWTVSNRLQNYIAGRVPSNEVNMRINFGRVSNLVKGTKCDLNARSHRAHHGHRF